MVSFDDFCVAELPSLTKYARLLTGSRDSAHDLLMNALLKTHDRWLRIGSMNYPRAYVRTIILSTYLDHQRSWYSRTVRTVGDDFPEFETTPQFDVDSRVDFEAALSQLRPQQRAVMVSRYYLDMTDEQIAAGMGIARSTVRSVAHRAVKEMYDLLRPLVPEAKN